MAELTETDIPPSSSEQNEETVNSEKTEKEHELIENNSDSSATASPAKKADKSLKVDVLLKPAGDAPIMKKKKWTVDRYKKVGWIMDFIKKYCKFEDEDSLFVYVNQSFSPAPDIDVGVLYDCFGSDGKLVLHYCKSQAWG